MKRVCLLVVLLLIVATSFVYAKPGVIDPKKQYTIVHWDFPHWAGYDQWIAQQAAAFKKVYPNITVAPEIVSWAEGYGQKFEIAFASGNPPDVMYGGSERLNPRYLDEGLVVPIDEYLTSQDLADYEEYPIGHFTYNNKVWAWPRWVALHCWYGNKALLEAAGANIANIQKKGWTWDEFFAIAKKATKDNRGDGLKQYGFSTDKDTAFQILWMLTMNAGVQPNYIFFAGINEKGDYLWKGDRVVEAATLIRRLIDEGIMPKEVGGMASSSRDDLFWNGQLAIGGRTGPVVLNTLANMKQEIKDGKRTAPAKGLPEVVLLPPPHMAGQPEVPWVGAAGYFVFRQLKYKGDDHIAAAMAWAKFLTDAERGGYAASQMRTMPARGSGQDKYISSLDLDTANGQFFLREVKIAVKDIKRLPIAMAEKATRIQLEAMQPLWQGFLAGQMTPAGYVAEVEKKALQILKEK